MNAPDGARYTFDAGSLYPEFLLAGGPGEFARFDTLHRPADLAHWAANSRLGLDPSAVTVRARELAAARTLRDALWRITWRVIAGEAVQDADRAIVNAAAARAPLAPQLAADGAVQWLTPCTGTAVLAAVARDAVEILAGPRAGRIRECAAHDCHLVFLDTSRPGSRRWCAMERCGNRQKVKDIRRRRAATSERSSA